MLHHGLSENHGYEYFDRVKEFKKHFNSVKYAN